MRKELFPSKYPNDIMYFHSVGAMKYLVSLILVTLLSRCDLCLSEEVEESSPRVVTPLGTIEGYYKVSSGGRRFEAYQGIPYAYPPIGKSRFEVAKPRTSPWPGVLMAKRFSLPCMQYTHFPVNPAEKVEGSEDCLYINVYTTVGDSNRRRGKEDPKNLLPVIFYIHGGAFQYGGGILYGPKYLLDNDIVLVTINYRLGPLGFLSTEDEVVPGNMGLKDQAIALRWVKDNIQFFGGDPSRVTIFGQSAGGASVHYHYLSKLSRGLFKSGMSLSGTALDCWTQTENSLEKAKKLATIVGCPSKDIRKMIKCMKDRPAHQIVQGVAEFMPWLYNPYSPFGPVVEKGSSEFTFIDRSPIDVITSGEAQDLPWITGVTSEEGLYPAADFVASEKLLKELKDNWETIAPHLLDFNYTIPKADHARVSNLIKEHYLGSKPIGKSTVNELVQMVGDRLFVYDGEEAAKLQARVNKSPVKFYYFSYRGAHSLSEQMSGSSENFGVSHADDLTYVLDAIFDSSTTREDRDMQKELINIWVSYATDGEPNVGIEWPNLSGSEEDFPHLYIAGPKEKYIKNGLDIGEKNFWSSIKFKENIMESKNRGEKNKSEL